MSRHAQHPEQAGLFAPADLGPPTSAGRDDVTQRAYADSMTAQAFTAWADALAGYSVADVPAGTPDTIPDALDERHIWSCRAARVCVWCGAYVQKVYAFPACGPCRDKREVDIP